jgi:hypothetical protein
MDAVIESSSACTVAGLPEAGDHRPMLSSLGGSLMMPQQAPSTISDRCVRMRLSQDASLLSSSTETCQLRLLDNNKDHLFLRYHYTVYVQLQIPATAANS